MGEQEADQAVDEVSRLLTFLRKKGVLYALAAVLLGGGGGATWCAGWEVNIETPGGAFQFTPNEVDPE